MGVVEQWFFDHGLRLTAIVLGGVVAYIFLRALVARLFELAEKGNTGRLSALKSVIRKVPKAVVVIVVGLLILSEFGISVTPIIASLGILGLALAFGSQSLVKDLVQGVFLLVEDICRIDEEVEINGKKGRIVKFQLRTLVLRAENREKIYIPYGDVKTLINCSRADDEV